MSDNTTSEHRIGMACDIVAAYVSHNSLPAAELPALITSVFTSLNQVSSGAAAPAVSEPVERPSAAQVRKSIGQDGIVSFIDGKAYKTLKRHLTANGYTPEQYRDRFGLPKDYPMVSPSYSEQRSTLAREIGLGVTTRKAA